MSRESTSRINSPAELEEFRKDIISKRDPNKPCITLCSGSACHASGSGKVATSLEEEIKKQGWGDAVDIRKTGCHGFPDHKGEEGHRALTLYRPRHQQKDRL